MNILVIGNGFDLAHGLPTKYTDFLEFCKRVFPIYENTEDRGVYFYQREYLFDWDFNDEIKEKITSAYESRRKVEIEGNSSQIQTNYPRLDEIYLGIKDNIWIEYFLRCDSYQKENWVDLESEISKVIQSLDGDMSAFDFEDSVQLISNKFLCEKYCNVETQITYKQIRNYLLNDLNRLIRTLEIYLVDYVEKIDCKLRSPDIQRILSKESINISVKPAYDLNVLSFNYTNTYQRLYIDKEPSYHYFERYIDYIHGKADINSTIESNNMVLGIDEYLSNDRKNKAIEFIAFKKYYQRIYKETGCKYKEWVNRIKERWEKESEEKKTEIRKYICKGNLGNNGIYKLYIFGHSLDVTDKDILRDLILNDNVYTTIYYHNKDTMKQQIANLVKVIGQDELIRRTGGSTKTIEFKQQKLMKKIK